MYHLDWLERHLPEGITLSYYPELHSTNSEALRLVEEENIPDGTLVLTGMQTAGRGRLQRTWVSDPADSLTFSLVLRDPALLPSEHPALLTLVAGVAVCETVQQLTGAAAAVKWPNDILLNGRKVCGILTESVFDPPVLSAVVVGIGVNVGLKSLPPADQMRYPASSIEGKTGIRVEREALLARILQNFYRWLPLAESQVFRSEYQKRLAFMGESVNIINEVDQTNVAGICAGITPTGALVINTSDEKQIEANAGEVSLRLKPEG